MKIAYFSPLHPLRTGIADYNTDLLLQFSCLPDLDIDIWIGDQAAPKDLLNSGFRVVDYVKNKEKLENLSEYDLIVYHMGNNLRHLNIYDIANTYPGLVVLHDYILISFFRSQSEEKFDREIAFNFNLNYDETSTSQFANLREKVFRHRFQYPMSDRLLLNSKGVVVHSDFVKNLIENRLPEVFVRKVNHYIHPQPDNIDIKSIRKRLGIKQHEFVVAAFGFMHKSKRIPQLLEAIHGVREHISVHCILVGECRDPDIAATIKRYELDDIVTTVGYVESASYADYLNACDVCVSLRIPTQGETSGNVCRALGAGKPCMVSNIGWFSELPDDVVCKIPINRSESVGIRSTLLELATNSQYRKAVGDRAKTYAMENHQIINVVDDYTCVFSTLMQQKRLLPQDL